MIDIPTVFILGAGASKPYGLPTSIELTSYAATHILDRNSIDVRNARLKDLGAPPPEDFIEMAQHLQSIRTMSIDEWVARNPKYFESGRIAIAYVISRQEGQDRSIAKNQDWLADLWVNYLSTDCLKIQDLKNNEVSFITFNYDRSLEHYLYQLISHTYSRASAEEVLKVANDFKIIHVHGQVGYLTWQTSDGAAPKKEFKASNSWEEAVRVSKQVKIISELEPKTSEYLQARKALAQSGRICFLGFGYHNENLRRLRPITKDETVKSKLVIGSAYELEDREFGILQSGTSPIGYPIQLDLGKTNCADFLKREMPRN